MNKYLMMSAAAALATTASGNAQAGSFSVHFGSASGGSYCSGFVGESTASFVVGEFIYTHCSPVSVYNKNIETMGLIAKGDKGIPGGKKPKAGNVGLLDYAFSVYDGIYSETALFDIETPIAPGAKWDLWIAVGDSAVIGNEGVLLPGQFARVPGKKAENLVEKVRATFRAGK